MKRAMIFTLALCVILCSCAAPAQINDEPAEPQQVSEPEPEAKPAPAFDLNAYKSSVDQFRRDVVDCTLNLSKLVAYEAAYMEASLKVSGSIEADKTAEYARNRLEEESGVSADDLESANDKIRSEYADLIIVEIEGKEAEELDAYIRAMYESFSDLYKTSKTASTSYDSFVNHVANAMSGISGANGNISLFCGDYG